MSIYLLLIPGIPLLSCAWWWWAIRRMRTMEVARGWRMFIHVVMIVLLSGYVCGVLERRGLFPFHLPSPLYSAVMLWGILILPLICLPMMVIWASGSVVNRLSRRKHTPPETSSVKTWTRRKWLGAAVVSFPVLTTLATACYSLPLMTRFRTRKMTIALADLPAVLDGLRIAHVSDTHVGKFTRGHVLDEIVAATNRLDADLVLFTGDLIDNSIQDLSVSVRMLQRMKSKSGLFLIEGNHDLFDDAEGFVQGVRDGGLNILRNQAAMVNVRGVHLQILGTVWHHDEEEIARDVQEVAQLRVPTAFPILLAHHPHAFDHAADLGFPLTLAGHTHGGQLMLSPEFGAGPMMFRYWSGLYRKGGSQLLVSNGTGNWFPLRLHAPAEIIEITLRRA